MKAVEGIFHIIVSVGVLSLEFVGVCILLWTAGVCIVMHLRGDEHVRLRLGEGIALALEFKLGGEVLRTAIVADLNELMVLGAIVLLRAAITFLIHWEIKNEKARLDVMHTKHYRRRRTDTIPEAMIDGNTTPDGKISDMEVE